MVDNVRDYKFIEDDEYGGDGIGFDKVLLTLLQRINTKRINLSDDEYCAGVDALLVNMSGMIEFPENDKLREEIKKLDGERKKELIGKRLNNDEFRMIELKYSRELHKILIKIIQKSTDILEVEVGKK